MYLYVCIYVIENVAALVLTLQIVVLSYILLPHVTLNTVDS